ncbi:ubiquinol-cytochrome c reductase iron-sulfur subunit [Sulfurimonas sp. HSL-3221]|uniref:ubiquinol-cytochrome c reductase iron-sulfur subunit n=1 Tax=Thiomicrolovo sulfuroxydans TaxID=2894755 RepID=UPI001E47043A|nr:ubiquinol-cytochrome c reductase iron-sulfur subunit [Sulfurimonas sp. HSL-3221]
MGKVFGAVAGVGAVGALYAMKKSWDPLPSVKAAGFTTIDLSAAEPNKLMVEKWRGKPIFVLKKTPEMVAKQSAEQTARDIVVNGDSFLICIGLCTHLGCIPAYREAKLDFKCACHGGEFDSSGIETKAPPPSPMEIPPFNVKGNTVVLGEEGEAYRKMKEAGVLA